MQFFVFKILKKKEGKNTNYFPLLVHFEIKELYE